MDDLLSEFLTETFESIEVVDVELVELEKDPNNKSVLDNIFRLVHTIKGTCGFLGLPRLEAVAHSGENVLGKFRDGEMEVTPDAVTLILSALDRIKEILAGLEETQEEPAGDDSGIINELNAMASGNAAPEVKVAAVTEAPIQVSDVRPSVPGEATLDELEAAFLAAPGPDEEDGAPEASSSSKLESVGGTETISVLSHLFHNRLLADASLKDLVSGTELRKSKKGVEEFFATSLESGKCNEEIIETSFASFINKGIVEDQFYNTTKHLESVLDEVGISSLDAEFIKDIYSQASTKLLKAAKKNSKSVGPAKKTEVAKKAAPVAKESSIANQSIRVTVDVLDNLMNMVSELVLTRNQLMQISRRAGGDNEFEIPLQRLSQCTSELQEGVMKTRMQPIGNAWSKLPRIIRDLQMELGKKIDLQMIGADTELDRQVLELIKDPLTHMIRNSADHGVETIEKRIAAGKKETGTIRLNAFHEGGQIIIEISDDGAGLPVDKLAAKALANGLATEEELAEMSDQQIQRFIFNAGFSTAQKVTSVSGRGVGMDVVRTNIEKIGGTIELKSTEGKGTTFFIKIPLTLAIVSALIVESNAERFAIPQISVLELVRASTDSTHKIEYINSTPVLRLRDRLLPLLHLNKILGFDVQEEGTDEVKLGSVNDDFIIITQVGDFTFGIVVDRVFDTEEIVVKPVAPILRDLNVFSGNTILGDGTVIMILDPIRQAVLETIAQDQTFVLMDTIKESYSSMVASLNTDIGGIHVFSGGRTDVKPVTGEQLGDLVAAAAAGDLFQNDQRKAVAKIGKNTNMEYSLLADEVAEDIFAAIKNIADFDNLTPISGQLTPAQNAFLESQLVVLDAAIEDLRIINSSNGMRYGRADDLLEEHQARETFMLNFISDIEDVNMAEAITRVNNDQIALDVSYKLTSELSRMSLLNFI
jgi:two-component system, chemotaxis family, sensor kinase CheA